MAVTPCYKDYFPSGDPTFIIKQGNISSMTERSTDDKGKTTATSTYLFSSSGLINAVSYTDLGKFSVFYSYSVSSVVGSMKYTVPNRWTDYVTYEYTQMLDKTEEDEAQDFIVKKTYDGSGRLVKEEDHSFNHLSHFLGPKRLNYTCLRTGSEKVIEIIELGEVITTTETALNSEGRVMSRLEYYNNTPLRLKTTYQVIDGEDIVTFNTFNQKGDRVSNGAFVFDRYGRTTSHFEENNGFRREYKWVYDDQVNWVKMEYTENGELKDTTLRTILYSHRS